MSSGPLCSCFQWSNCVLTASLSHKSYKRIESRMNPSPDHHLVLVAVQVAPDLFSFRDNQTQWGHTHCCLFLETDSDASFASCLAALMIRGLDIDPTSTLIIQLPRVAWPGDIFSTCFWLNVAVLVCVILPALKTKFFYHDSLFFLPLWGLPLRCFFWCCSFPCC